MPSLQALDWYDILDRACGKAGTSFLRGQISLGRADFVQCVLDTAGVGR